MSYIKCLNALTRAAGRKLSESEISDIYERVHKAALDIKAGRAEPGDVGLGKKRTAEIGGGPAGEALTQHIFERAAQQAAADLLHEAKVKERNANLQVTKLAARMGDVETIKAAGLKDLDAVEKTITRDYTGRFSVESLEQKVMGYKSYFESRILPAWEALGSDFLGIFQDRQKLVNLIRELRGESTGDALAAKGAKSFHDAAEEARRTFNEAGGDIGKLDDWGMPQHHSQEKVAAAGKDVWMNTILPMLDRKRYVDDLGVPFTDTQMHDFLGHAWDTIATNGHANIEPGGFRGAGAKANRHAEHRQIHFKDAQSVIDYWNAFGDKTAFEILHGHIDRMARDIAFIEHFGPNPDSTYRTLRDAGLKAAAISEPTKTIEFEGRAVKLDNLYNYVAGRTKPSANKTLSGIADGIAHLNAAGKLGGAMWASLYGDKATMEAVSHLNDLPLVQRWRTELSLLNPANTADRKLIQRQGLMLDSVRSGLQRFYEGLGGSSITGRIANAVLRITGMNAINDIRTASFGLSLMDAIGNEIKKGVQFDALPDSDIRTLRNYGITRADWDTWKLAKLDDMGHGNDSVLTPEGISRIPDDALKAAGVIGQADGQAAARTARRNAIVKLLGAVNTESEFAIVKPGWHERAAFYSDLQRGTIKGEIARSVLQFKSFPWAYLQRGMDLVANQETPSSKAAMVAYLVASTTLAGALIIQTREMLSGKDPRKMFDEDWYKFWGAAFLQGGALGIYGDFLYSVNQTRYGTGPLEALAGPTLGPLLEMGVVQPLTAVKQKMEGRDAHYLAKVVQDIKGFVPGGNIWYTKAALDHMIWQNVMESLSPGYLASIRAKTQREYGQQWWWAPGELSPERAPDLSNAIAK